MVHLPYQVRVGGPVKYTWMYGVERYTFRTSVLFHLAIIFKELIVTKNSCRLLKKVRAKVHNKAHVEASIVEGCLVEEITHLTSLYLPNLISSS